MGDDHLFKYIAKDINRWTNPFTKQDYLKTIQFQFNAPHAHSIVNGITDTGHTHLEYAFVGEVHKLQIINRNPDIGQDDYHADYDWIMHHDPRCEKRMHSRYEIEYRLSGKPLKQNVIDSPYSRNDEVWVYECVIADEINANGLQNLIPMKWEELEEGEYAVRAQVSKERVYQHSGQRARHAQIVLL